VAAPIRSDATACKAPMCKYYTRHLEWIHLAALKVINWCFRFGERTPRQSRRMRMTRILFHPKHRVIQ
jgi:hypothetical protein